MDRPALSVGDNRPDRDRVERRALDGDHGAGRPPEIPVPAQAALLVPATHCLAENLWLDLEMPGQVIERVKPANDADLDLPEVVLAPLKVEPVIVDFWLADGAELSPFFVTKKRVKNYPLFRILRIRSMPCRATQSRSNHPTKSVNFAPARFSTVIGLRSRWSGARTRWAISQLTGGKGFKELICSSVK